MAANSPLLLYVKARAFYNQPKWNRSQLVSKRLRMVIRLIAMEEVCQDLGVGALPPRIMVTLRLLSGYKAATHKRYYRMAGDRSDALPPPPEPTDPLRTRRYRSMRSRAAKAERAAQWPSDPLS